MWPTGHRQVGEGVHSRICFHQSGVVLRLSISLGGLGVGVGRPRSKMQKDEEGAQNEAMHEETAGSNAQGKVWKVKRAYLQSDYSVRNWAQQCTYAVSLSSHNSGRGVILLSLFYRWGNGGPKS